MSGKWYRDTYFECIGDQTVFVDPETGEAYDNWVVPVQFYNDKTGSSPSEGSYTLEPFVFTLGIIRREIRELARAWRHAGFIPSCSSVNNGNNGSLSAEETLSFTHECLSILLEDLAYLQENPPLLKLFLFGKERKVRLLLQVSFVIGDQLSQDTHCCRKKVNAGGAGRVHRSCLTSFLNSSTPQEGGCRIIPKKTLDQLCEKVWEWEDENKRNIVVNQILNNGIVMEVEKVEKIIRIRGELSRDILGKVFSIYPVHNAWSRISFGSNKDGIHRATLDDPMHYSALGLFTYVAKVAFLGLQRKEAELLEKFLREEFKNRSSVRYQFPRGKFTKGFTNCTLLTASEKVGLMHALYIGLGTERIKRIFQKSILRQQQKYCDLSSFEESGSSRPCSSKQQQDGSSTFDMNRLPLIGDKYFFKINSVLENDLGIDRTLVGVTKLITDLDSLRLLTTIESILPYLDSLQAEYLLQCIHDRIKSNMRGPLDIPNGFWEVRATTKTRIVSMSRTIQKVIRQQPTHKADSVHPITIPSTIQSRIRKHWLDKPKVSGTGDTSAILTDVDGLRKLLEKILIFHSLIHRFHIIKPKLQFRLSGLQEKFDELNHEVFESIYRGDCSVDVRTCKCHAHFHIIQDIKYYGAPMGFEASKGERNLKTWAKHVCKTARKCGESVFIEQTARRVTDHLLLEKALDVVTQSSVKDKESGVKETTGVSPQTWKFTRKLPHVVYHMETDLAYMNGTTPVDFPELINEPIKEVLQRTHPQDTIINIWKEIRIDFPTSVGGYHHVRAYHQFDVHGAFFDWVQIKSESRQRKADGSEEVTATYT